MRIFNRDNNGGEEIHSAIGMISSAVDFDTWAPLLPLGLKDVAAIVGNEPVAALCEFYEGGAVPDDDRFPPSAIIPMGYLQQAVAYFTWLKLIPTLDAQHDNTGRQRRLGENEKGLTALQEFKDEENIRHLAYEYTELLVESLDRGLFTWWVNSPKYKLRNGLLIRSKEAFDEYYVIGSHRLFITLLPIMQEVQRNEILPVVGDVYMRDMLAKDGQAYHTLNDAACRVLALLTIKKAVERLPLEVLPEGITQIKQTAPVRQRTSADKQTRDAVAAYLGDDAARYLSRLASLVAIMTETDAVTDASYVAGPIVHSKGMSY